MRTERIGIALTKEEKARIRIESADLHISMSALIRMRIFAKPVQPVQQYTPLPRLNRPPLPPQQMGVKGLLVQELKDVLSQGIELRFKKYDHKPHNDLEIRDQLRIQRIKKEEDLLKEVEIK